MTGKMKDEEYSGNCAKILQLGKLYTNFWVSFSHKDGKYKN